LPPSTSTRVSSLVHLSTVLSSKLSRLIHEGLKKRCLDPVISRL
jgi:hypothetical protein